MSEWRKYRWVILGAGAVLFFAAPVHAGFLIFFVFPVLAIWAIYQIVRARKEKERLKPLGIKLAVWLAVIAVVLGHHWYLAKSARADADFLLGKVVDYRTQKGVWPKDLMEAGISDPNFGHDWMLHYEAPNNQPDLWYLATFVPFDTYGYDFQTMQWRYKVD